MFREEMQVLGLPGAEDVTDGSVDYYDMDWEKRRERRDGGADGKVHRKRVRLHATLQVQREPAGPVRRRSL